MAQTHDLATRLTPIGELRPHPRNPRNGDVDQIAVSLEVNGQYRPIVAARDGVILAGNHTYAAAMELGWDHIAAVHLDLDPSSDEAVRIMLADNRTADLGQYDDGLLLELLRDAPNLEGSGYSEDDLAVLIAHMDQVEAAPLSVEDFDTISQAGWATLTITELTNAEVGAFRALPGDTDADRLRGLLNG